VADGRYRLAALHEPADELHGVRLKSQGVRVGHTARQHEGVEVIDRHVLHDGVDGNSVGPVEVVEELGLAVLRADQHRLVTRVLHGVPRIGEFDPLGALRRDDKGDLLALRHRVGPFCVRSAVPSRVPNFR
jgi:hypothetical protein